MVEFRIEPGIFWKEGDFGRKRKQNHVALVLEDLNFKKCQTEKVVNKLEEMTKNENDCSIGNCIASLELIEELTNEEKAKILELFKCKLNREIFMSTKNPSVRLIWLKGLISP
ncbi:hypothetical protein ABZP36_029096 [Zizania latifolia]